MKQDIENIIKKNLPEKINNEYADNDAKKADNPRIAEMLGRQAGFNQALSQINTSLIANEVLKVVRQIIEDKIKFQKEVVPSSYETGYTHALEDLLSNLSTN